MSSSSSRPWRFRFLDWQGVSVVRALVSTTFSSTSRVRTLFDVYELALSRRSTVLRVGAITVGVCEKQRRMKRPRIDHDAPFPKITRLVASSFCDFGVRNTTHTIHHILLLIMDR